MLRIRFAQIAQKFKTLFEKTCLYGPARFHVIVSYEGPFTKWIRSRREWLVVHHDNVVEALEDSAGDLLPKPDEREILLQAGFRCRRVAIWWAKTRSRDLRNVRVEVWPI